MKTINIIKNIIIISMLLSFTFTEYNIIKLPKPLNKTFRFIPMGLAFIDKDSSSVMAFYISAYEVSNKEYREFLKDLLNNKKTSEYNIAIYDSSKWTDNLGYNEPFRNLYHSHPAYDNYPVVNISQEGALLYCKWMSEKYQNIYSSEYDIKFSIPSKWQYIRASRGDNKYSDYPWNSYYLRNKKGQILCNHNSIGSENIHYNSEKKQYEVVNNGNYSIYLNDNADITAPVNSYYPNSFGVYNLSGNVSEMVIEKGEAYGGNWSSTGYDVKVESKIEFINASRYVGFRPVLYFVKKLKN